MTSRINLAKVRAKAEYAYGRTRRPASPTEVLALVEAVEAAHRALILTTDEDDQTWVSFSPAQAAPLEKALRRFDFGAAA